MLSVLQFIYDLFSLAKGPAVIRDIMDDDPTKPKEIIVGKLTVNQSSTRDGKPVRQNESLDSPKSTP
jgi:hypothetical protein